MPGYQAGGLILPNVAQAYRPIGTKDRFLTCFRLPVLRASGGRQGSAGRRWFGPLCRLLVLERRLLTALLGSLVPDDVEAVNRALLTVFGLK